MITSIAMTVECTMKSRDCIPQEPKLNHTRVNGWSKRWWSYKEFKDRFDNANTIQSYFTLSEKNKWSAKKEYKRQYKPLQSAIASIMEAQFVPTKFEIDIQATPVDESDRDDDSDSKEDEDE